MSRLNKSAALVLGAIVLATTPQASNAMTVKPVPVAQEMDGSIVKVGRRGRRVGRVLGAVAIGAIVGSIISRGIHARDRRYRDARHREHRNIYRHERWCERKYRSYRVWDNTFQPYHGGRRECRSPYF